MNKKKKVILGISGGVDSAVSALLLKDQGYEVIGLFMKNWDENDENCTALEDSDDAMQVCQKLGIKYYTINFEKDYWDKVFSYFLKELKNGRTPNPDVMCNTEIKFKAFLDYALSLDADYIAMGHYANVEKIGDKFVLKRGLDENKDQSYFLARITSEALSKTLFPIGNLKKSKVRELAKENDFINASKKDSTGICFIGERNFNEFLDKHLLSKKGDIIDMDTGNIVGTHTGLIHYTIGQRKGIGIGGVGNGEPWFVAEKNLKENKLYVVQGKNNPALFSNYLIAEDFKWISGEKPKMPMKCTAKFRYRQPDIPVTIEEKNGFIKITYDNPVKAVTPGQVAVIYNGDICLGGGIIKNRFGGKYELFR